MANTNTTIGWTNATWSPVVGCTKVTRGCDRCYAETIWQRFHTGYLKNDGTLPNGRPMPRQFAKPFTEVQLLPERLEWPLTVKKPSMIFVNSVSDLLHSAVPDDFIRQVFDVMKRAHWHTFQILTKRGGRLRELGPHLDWPENVWIGTSIEENLLVGRADQLRIGAAKAAVRFISAEPLLGPLPSLNLKDIDWLIAGSESGRGARPMQDEWVRDLRDRCASRGIPLFFKQRSDASGHKIVHPVLDGRTWEQFPASRVQVNLNDFAAQHGIAPMWGTQALMQGWLDLAPVGQRNPAIARPIDDMGRRCFWATFHTRPEFVSCPTCPHALIVEAPVAPARQATLWEQETAGPATPPESPQFALARYTQEVTG